jgi:hypothetical protein
MTSLTEATQSAACDYTYVRALLAADAPECSAAHAAYKEAQWREIGYGHREAHRPECVVLEAQDWIKADMNIRPCYFCGRVMTTIKYRGSGRH